MKTNDDTKYYCVHCGHVSYTQRWFLGRCAQCGSSTQPKEWRRGRGRSR